MGLVDLIDRLIVEHGSAAIQKEHVALFKDQAAILERDCNRLKQELAALQLENARLRQQLAAVPAPTFQRIHGLLWMPEGNGYERNPYCPKCQSLMSEFPPRTHWSCDPCQIVVNWCPPPERKVC